MTTRQTLLGIFAQAPDRIDAALAHYPRAMWHFKPDPAAWSIHEQVIHLADSEAYAYVRLRHAIAEPGSRVTAYDQDAWTVRLHYASQDPAEALALFRALRQMSARLLGSLPEEAWAGTIEHPENGTMMLDDILALYTNHAEGHLAQMEACFAAWQKVSGHA